MPEKYGHFVGVIQLLVMMVETLWVVEDFVAEGLIEDVKLLPAIRWILLEEHQMQVLYLKS